MRTRRVFQVREKKSQVGWESLTARELEVLAALAEGLTYVGISRRLEISAGTVKNHVARLYPKIGVTTAMEAARAYVAHQQGQKD